MEQPAAARSAAPESPHLERPARPLARILHRVGLLSLQGLQTLGATYAIVPPPDTAPAGTSSATVGR